MVFFIIIIKYIFTSAILDWYLATVYCSTTHKTVLKHLHLCTVYVSLAHRRRIHTEEKVKVVAAAMGDRFASIPCRASYLVFCYSSNRHSERGKELNQFSHLSSSDVFVFSSVFILLFLWFSSPTLYGQPGLPGDQGVLRLRPAGGHLQTIKLL